MDLKGLVEGTDTTAGRLFDIMIQALIIISLVSFSVDTLPNLSASARQNTGGSLQKRKTARPVN